MIFITDFKSILNLISEPETTMQPIKKLPVKERFFIYFSFKTSRIIWQPCLISSIEMVRGGEILMYSFL